MRSGPELDRLKIVPPDPALKHGRQYLVGYVGVMGEQEGIDLLLQSCATSSMIWAARHPFRSGRRWHVAGRR